MNEKNKTEMSKTESFWKNLENARKTLGEIGGSDPDPPVPKW